MASAVQLRKGDMFAEPSDLIIIPCSTAGTITDAVARQLENFDIRPPKKRMALGDVEFELFKGATNIAMYVGYAASVQMRWTTSAAISSISEQVGRFVKDKGEIRNVTFPLLGSGAGGLTADDSAKAIVAGLERVPVNDKVFNIFVFKGDEFEQLRREPSQRRQDVEATEGLQKSVDHLPRIEKTREPIRVFISYTRTTVEHQKRVRDLGTYLRENGIDARLDIWHLRPGMDIPQWMSNELDLADRVLIICNEEYAARADGRIGGVGWEIRLVQGDMLQAQQENSKKFIPVTFDATTSEKLPRFLRGSFAVIWPDPDPSDPYRITLLKELYDAYEAAPPLGSPPRHVLR